MLKQEGFTKWKNIEVEDDVTAYVEYENGATGLFITTTGEAPGTNRLEVTGDNGKIVVEGGKLSRVGPGANSHTGGRFARCERDVIYPEAPSLLAQVLSI